MKTDSEIPCCRILYSLFLALLTAACSSVPTSHEPASDLTVLTLNLHTYQELRAAESTEAELTDEQALRRIEAYGAIFDRIAAGIEQLDPDIICLQEVGEWSGTRHAEPEAVEFGASDTNMVHQILSRLGDRHYHYAMDWSHYGWNVWLEGSAILSKFPLRNAESRFISKPANNTRDNWKSRNVPMATIDLPEIGSVAIFSVHAGWWDDPEEPFHEQYQRLLQWAAEVTEPAGATILCGDFNVAAAGPGYAFMTQGTGYTDQYALANPNGMLDATIGGGEDGWEDSSAGRRIDYILMNENSPLEVTRARRVFTDDYLGRVSDHVGVYAEFVISPGK